MEKLLDLISGQVAAAFTAAGFDQAYGKVTASNRPDLCEFQCNGALAAAKRYHQNPLAIAQAVVQGLNARDFAMAEAVAPGFINLRVSGEFLRDYLAGMQMSPDFGVEKEPSPKTIVVDYGGPNVAKPLHIGHLRSAIIGESIKRIYRFFGNRVIGDVHLGDWGLQMGLIIASLADRHPDWPYFDENYTGPYPAEPPFTMAQLEQVYPAASARSKTDPAFSQRAHEAVYALQQGRPGYMALWRHIMAVSLPDVRKNYDNLDVHFDTWLGESDAKPYIAPMLAGLQEKNLVVESDGALIFPVALPGDRKEVPPCILVKSDGSALYDTTDLATLVQREQDYHPDKVLYLADKRQSLHFEQIFRAARMADIVRPETELEFLGFGTMNGKDGKPFKTRDGGVMRLERLIADITEFVRKKVVENQVVEPEAVEETTRRIAMAALKYGDLSNQPAKDYIFDMDRFAAFEGNTGPYILYTIVRINSILAKYGPWQHLTVPIPENQIQKNLMLAIAGLSPALQSAYRDSAPNVICAYIYALSGAVNTFYHETRILTEPDAHRQAGYIALIGLAKGILERCIDLLGFQAPEKM